MEEKINIAEILKDKSEGTKLWTDMFGSVTLYVVTVACDAFQVKHHNKEPWFDKEGKLYKEGVLCIYPSKSMRDWSKFAWKKGDVLVSEDRTAHLIFEKFTDETYTTFIGKYHYANNDYYVSECDSAITDLYTLETENSALTYINTIEERLGGKLNRETLEVEKPQPEFKDGDILSCDEDSYTRHTTLIFHKNGDTRESIVSLIRHKKLIEANEPINNFLLSRLNYASEDEKKELFNALAKEGKAWDAKKKVIVSLPKKCKFKAFDKVLCRDWDRGKWGADFFSHYDENSDYHFVCIKGVYKQCIPYNDMTRHLLCTTGEWKG